MQRQKYFSSYVTSDHYNAVSQAFVFQIESPENLENLQISDENSSVETQESL